MSKAKKYVYMSKMLDIMCNIFPGTDRYLHNVGKNLFGGFMKWFHAIDVKVKRYVAKKLKIPYIKYSIFYLFKGRVLKPIQSIVLFLSKHHF